MWGGVNLKKSGLASALPKGGVTVSQKKGFGTPGDFIPPLPMPVRDKERQEAIKKRNEAKENGGRHSTATVGTTTGARMVQK